MRAHVYHQANIVCRQHHFSIYIFFVRNFFFLYEHTNRFIRHILLQFTMVFVAVSLISCPTISAIHLSISSRSLSCTLFLSASGFVILASHRLSHTMKRDLCIFSCASALYMLDVCALVLSSVSSSSAYFFSYFCSCLLRFTLFCLHFRYYFSFYTFYFALCCIRYLI